MNGDTYLHLALATAALGLAVKVIGILATRWHKKLSRDLERMKARGRSSE